MSQITATTPIPLLAGQAIFGDFDSFQVVNLQQGTTAEIDTFLGLQIGTTKYAADSGGHLYAATGQFLGPSAQSIQQQVRTLLSFQGITATYRRPTGEIYPGNAWHEHNCYFSSGDITFGAMAQLGVNWFGQTFAIVLRQIPKA